MRDLRFLLKTHYANSHALVIGIDSYAKAPPLSYAVSDALEFKNTLIEEFGFPAENIAYLTDSTATRDGIRRAFFRFARDDIGLDDRIVIFFAGHGHTISGGRGEVGFLIPHDADMTDYSSFVRWDDLTKNSELVRCKHMLFVMDACYGGLALTRSTMPGSTRFLKDMMLRYSRQVLTAGKADEVVADAGGPLPNHSVFTGHLLEALRGKAASEDGVITASGVMAYVHAKVAADRNSNQTPHYGYFDGDGDFIFRAPGLLELERTEERDLDRLVVVPYPEEPVEPGNTSSKITRLKTLLSGEESAIEVHDFLVREIRQFLAATSDDSFAVTSQYSHEEFVSRLSKYESASSDISVLLACLAYWAKPVHIATLQKCISRSTDRFDSRGGQTIWLELRWYPLVLQVYCAGIAAIDAQRFDTLASVFYSPVSAEHHREGEGLVVEALGLHLLELNRSNVLKSIPGHEKNFTPLSEYLFKILQPKLDELLFLGKNYENAFDTYEVFFALAVADMRQVHNHDVWGPFGRFGWKHRRGHGSPLEKVLLEARAMKDKWPPLQAGMFGGSFERFDKVATEYEAQVRELQWF